MNIYLILNFKALILYKRYYFIDNHWTNERFAYGLLTNSQIFYLNKKNEHMTHKWIYYWIHIKWKSIINHEPSIVCDLIINFLFIFSRIECAFRNGQKFCVFDKLYSKRRHTCNRYIYKMNRKSISLNIRLLHSVREGEKSN